MTLNSDIRTGFTAEIARQGLTLRKVAMKMGRSHHWLGTKLRGTSVMDADEIEEIAKTLGVDPLSFIIEHYSGPDQVD